MTQTLIFDLESNGFLRKLTRIHVLVIHDPDTKETFVFRHNDAENTIAEGVRMLEKADVLVGHNAVAFDAPALKKIHPDFKPKGVIRDTLVMCRVSAPDIRDHDFNLWRRNLLPGNLIGSHSLEAWGYRINKHKGDYSKQMAAKGLDPWAAWNQEMEDYCVGDVEVTTVIWSLVNQQSVPDLCVTLEHEIHALCAQMERNGFPFDVEQAEGLASRLKVEANTIESGIKARYGMRFVPKGKKQIHAYWNDPDGKNQAKEASGMFDKPDPLWGEDDSRKWWAKFDVPKRTYTRNGIEYTEGAAHCKAHWVEFNPGSRQQVVARLVEDHGWVPTEFTETGQPALDGPSLEKLAEDVPVAKEIAELFFLKKLIGQLADGPESWIKNYDPETGCVHPYTNTGGTVTGRCSHSSPNIAQVPAVLAKKYKDDEQFIRVPVLENGIWRYRDEPVPEGKKRHKEYPKLGRDGEYGWECRSLFRVPEFWKQVGVDLKGIEFRCLAALTAEFDGGELIEVVLTGDVHSYNMEKTGIPSRDIVKRVLYGLLYGAGDLKLGLTAKPTASDSEARMIGAGLRAQLMAGLPALKKAIDKVQKEAERGFLIGLDGRRLKVRAVYSALNTRLQHDAAIIAKKWCVLTDQYARDAGMAHGWKDHGDDGLEYLGDFAMLAFVHDEQQNAVNPDRADEFAAISVKAAQDAGTFFNFACPVDADPKIGLTWAECH
jgi:DNA polymerase I-like protein with 3'-5' exonuclease and polymerase domains